MEGRVFFLIRILHRAFTSRLKKSDESRNVNTFHCMITNFIAIRDEKGLKTIQKDIEKEFLVGKAVCSEHVDILCNDGYLNREKDEFDARKYNLVLTEKGKEFVTENYKYLVAIEDEVLEGLIEDEIKELKRILKKLYKELKEEG